MNVLINKLDELKFKLVGLVAVTSGIILIKKKIFSGLIYNSLQRLEGKKVIITGSNCGIGYETALDLANRGAFVIMACRDFQKAEVSCDKIKNKTKNKNVYVEFLDLASLDSVKDFSHKMLLEHEYIDILINNAGVMSTPYSKTKDNFEYQFQVNYLGHYLLTRSLLELLKQSPSGRIINLTSKLYETGSVDLNDINLEKSYTPIKGYKQSKLCNILFTNQLAIELQNTNLTVCSVSPGVVLTNLGRYILANSSFLKKVAYFLFYPIIWYLLRTPKEGAQTTIYCAIEPNLKNGLFYRNCKETILISNATDTQKAKDLWILSENLVKKWL